MRKKHCPGNPCCPYSEEPPSGYCDCGTQLRVDIYDADDTMIAYQYDYGDGVTCCAQTISGFSAIEGTYYLDVSGTPDYSDALHDYYILNTVGATENPVNPASAGCPGQHYCVKLRAIFKSVKDTVLGDPRCTGDVIFELGFEFVGPDIDGNILCSEGFSPSLASFDPYGYHLCVDNLGISKYLRSSYMGISSPCPERFWNVKYDITNVS